MHIVIHLLKHFGIPGLCLVVIGLFSPAGCEEGLHGFEVVQHCHAPLEHSLSIDEVHGFSGQSQVKVWGQGPAAIDFGTYKFLTTILPILVGILAFIGMGVTQGNPFKWPGEP